MLYHLRTFTFRVRQVSHFPRSVIVAHLRPGVGVTVLFDFWRSVCLNASFRGMDIASSNALIFRDSVCLNTIVAVTSLSGNEKFMIAPGAEIVTEGPTQWCLVPVDHFLESAFLALSPEKERYDQRRSLASAFR